MVYGEVDSQAVMEHTLFNSYSELMQTTAGPVKQLALAVTSIRLLPGQLD